MTKQQIPKLAGALVEHQEHFESLSNEDAQWVIQNTTEAVALFVGAIKNRNKKFVEIVPIVVPHIVKLTNSFDPVTFIGKEWKRIKEDSQTAITKEFDVLKIKLICPLKQGELSFTGEERRKRLLLEPGVKLGLDASLFFWENQNQIPEEWKKVGYVTFDGDVLVSPTGGDAFLCLFWRGDRWRWEYRWLISTFRDRGLSAVLTP